MAYLNDATISFTPTLGMFKFNIEGTYSRMDIDDWIMWISTGNGYIWSPVNFNRVLSQGVELSCKANFKTKDFYHKLIFNYAYSPSADQSYCTDVYITHDAELSYLLNTKKNNKIKFSERVDNISNAYYESTQYYPMPLRSCYGSIAFTF